MKPYFLPLVAMVAMALTGNVRVSAQVVSSTGLLDVNDQTEPADFPTSQAVFDINTGGATPGLAGNTVNGYVFYSPDAGSATIASPFVSSPGYATVSLETATALESYTSGASNHNDYQKYSVIDADGTTFTSGITYLSTPTEVRSSTTTYYNLATIKLGTNVPGTFTLGLLTGSTNDTHNNPLFQVVGSNTLDVNSSRDANDSAVDNVNDFYYVTVTGARAGETLQINVGNQPDSSTYQNVFGLTGITFSSVPGTPPLPTPEPSTYALILAGLGLLLVKGVRRLRATRSSFSI